MSRCQNLVRHCGLDLCSSRWRVWTGSGCARRSHLLARLQRGGRRTRIPWRHRWHMREDPRCGFSSSGKERRESRANVRRVGRRLLAGGQHQALGPTSVQQAGFSVCSHACVCSLAAQRGRPCVPGPIPIHDLKKAGGSARHRPPN